MKTHDYFESLTFESKPFHFYDVRLFKCLLDFFDVIQFFPCEKFYFFFDGWPVIRGEHFFDDSGGTSHVSVTSRFLIDRVTEFQAFLDSFRAQVENGEDFFGNGGVV